MEVSPQTSYRMLPKVMLRTMLPPKIHEKIGGDAGRMNIQPGEIVCLALCKHYGIDPDQFNFSPILLGKEPEN